MGRKIIKSSVVTREQYDKLQVDVVNRIEELEQTVERLVAATAETMTVQTTDNRRLAQANNNRHFEIRVVGICCGCRVCCRAGRCIDASVSLNNQPLAFRGGGLYHI